MRTVFADTLYWAAILNPRDPWHKASVQARRRLGEAVLVTCDEVLVEFLTILAAHGAEMRRAAADMVRGMQFQSNVQVRQQSRYTFLQGLRLYQNRLDKKYSLTDCISMWEMRNSRITEVLTNDHHFIQEGFTILIPEQV